MMTRNVLQYECWNYTGKEAITEALGRIPLVRRDRANGNDWGSRVKKVFRIHDTEGKMTRLITGIAQMHQQCDAILDRAGDTHGLPVLTQATESMYGLIGLEVNQSLIKIRIGDLLHYSRKYMSSIVHNASENEVAIEPYEGSFRIMNRVEVFELSQYIAQAKRLHIYAFAPNDLCAERNNIIAAVLEKC